MTLIVSMHCARQCIAGNRGRCDRGWFNLKTVDGEDVLMDSTDDGSGGGASPGSGAAAAKLAEQEKAQRGEWHATQQKLVLQEAGAGAGVDEKALLVPHPASEQRQSASHGFTESDLDHHHKMKVKKGESTEGSLDQMKAVLDKSATSAAVTAADEQIFSKEQVELLDPADLHNATHHFDSCVHVHS